MIWSGSPSPARTAGVEAIAICFLHAYAHPEHEARAAMYLRERLPGVAITASSEITSEWREFERSSTAVLNAYVQPILDRYLADLETRLRAGGVDGALFAMLSNGGTATFDAARQTPINLVESGPVAGITGAALIGELIGEPNLISLDIGGTTAKCSLIEGGEVRITGRLPAGGDAALTGLSAEGAGGRHRRDRRGRRQHRLVRRRRRAAGRSALGRGRSRARPATGAAARSRPSPTRC